MRVTCASPCAHEFCWVCLRAWSDHGRSGGCNGFEERKRKRVMSKRRQRISTLSLDRYAHYFERWSANDASMAKAVAELRGLEAGELARLGERQNVFDCRFVLDAWALIVECRRVLKWSYAYGYFLPRGEEGKKKVLFEFLQGAAEAELERLHRLAEVELRVFLDAEGLCRPSIHPSL